MGALESALKPELLQISRLAFDFAKGLSCLSPLLPPRPLSPSLFLVLGTCLASLSQVVLSWRPGTEALARGNSDPPLPPSPRPSLTTLLC